MCVCVHSTRTLASATTRKTTNNKNLFFSYHASSTRCCSSAIYTNNYSIANSVHPVRMRINCCCATVVTKAITPIASNRKWTIYPTVIGTYINSTHSYIYLLHTYTYIYLLLLSTVRFFESILS